MPHRRTRWPPIPSRRRAGAFPGDHAGRYELSQLLYIRPDLVDMTRLDRVPPTRSALPYR